MHAGDQNHPPTLLHEFRHFVTMHTYARGLQFVQFRPPLSTFGQSAAPSLGGPRKEIRDSTRSTATWRSRMSFPARRSSGKTLSKRSTSKSRSPLTVKPEHALISGYFNAAMVPIFDHWMALSTKLASPASWASLAGLAQLFLLTQDSRGLSSNRLVQIRFFGSGLKRVCENRKHFHERSAEPQIPRLRSG